MDPAERRPPLGEYLRAVADALAAPDATADRMLAAARARDVRRGLDHAEFAAPDPRLAGGRLKLTGVADVGTPPGSVAFRAADAGDPIVLPELAAAFGTWSLGTPGPGLNNPWPADFDDNYRPTGAKAAAAASIFVSASLSGDPAAAGTRVERILLRRDPDAV